MNNKEKICIISAPNPHENGGIGIYVKYLINQLQKNKKNLDIYHIYRGENNKKYKENNIKYIEIKVPFPRKAFYSIFREFIFNKKVEKILKNNYFQIINSHATWGYWMKNYKKNNSKQKIIHTYHGVTRNFFKTHLRRMSKIKKILFIFSLLYAKIIENPPMKKADKIICVSEKVKKQLQEIYYKRNEMYVLRTGVDLNKFKYENKEKIKQELKLNKKDEYGLYIGSGSGWNKGLDRAINISKELFKLNKNYKLLIIGPKYDNIKKYLKEPFIIYNKRVAREKIPKYYNSSEFVFCLSRYEGGAPIMVTSEAMASEIMVVCSKESEMEIIKDKKNGLVINEFSKKDAEKINNILKNKKQKKEIEKNALKTIKEISINNWSKKYFDILGVK